MSSVLVVLSAQVLQSFEPLTSQYYSALEKDCSWKPPGFEKEGFVHMCTKRQLAGVVDRFFANENDFAVLEFSSERSACVPLR